MLTELRANLFQTKEFYHRISYAHGTSTMPCTLSYQETKTQEAHLDYGKDMNFFLQILIEIFEKNFYRFITPIYVKFIH